MAVGSDQAVSGTSGRAGGRMMWTAIVGLMLIVFAFAGIRLAIDVPNVHAGRVPAPDSYDHRYALHPGLAYAHILTGIVYLLGAPFQLSRRFRTRHLALHRRMGRVVLTAGFVTGAFAIVFGSLFPWGGTAEASATVLFGACFLVALALALRAVKGRDLTGHRRWMIRAFAIGLSVGTMRIWIGLFQAFDVFTFQQSFGVAFWLSPVMHIIVAEIYLAGRPTAAGARRATL